MSPSFADPRVPPRPRLAVRFRHTRSSCSTAGSTGKALHGMRSVLCSGMQSLRYLDSGDRIPAALSSTGLQGTSWRKNPHGPPPRRPDETTSDRLDSWKDVAAYLQRDVSTVQRWEKREAMPVHRHVHEKQGTVYAFRLELDAWWRGRGGRLSQQEDGESGQVQAAPASREQENPRPGDPGLAATSQRPWWAHWRVILTGMGALGMVLTIVSGTYLSPGIGRTERRQHPDRRSGSRRRWSPRQSTVGNTASRFGGIRPAAEGAVPQRPDD